MEGAKYTLGIFQTPFAAQTASKVGLCPTSACSLRSRVWDIKNLRYSSGKKNANAIEQIIPYSSDKQPTVQSREMSRADKPIKKQNTSVRLYTLDVYPGVGYLRCGGE